MRKIGAALKRLQVFQIFRNFSTNLYPPVHQIQAIFLAAYFEGCTGLGLGKQRKKDVLPINAKNYFRLTNTGLQIQYALYL